MPQIAIGTRGIIMGKGWSRAARRCAMVIDANTQLAVAVGRPLPGNCNDCRAYAESGIDRQCAGAAVIAVGGYQGTGLIMPYRKPRDGSPLPGWKEDLNTVHRRVRARVEHALAHMKSWNILRNCQRKGEASTTPPVQWPSCATSP